MEFSLTKLPQTKCYTGTDTNIKRNKPVNQYYGLILAYHIYKYNKYSKVSFSTVFVRLYLAKDVIHKLQEDLIDIKIILSTRFAEAHSTYLRCKLQQK